MNTLLAWVDMEMTGLNPEIDRILEIAIVITDTNLTLIDTDFVRVIHQENTILNQMCSWNQQTHNRSGLIDKVKNSQFNEAQIEVESIKFMEKYIKFGLSPMCGSTVHQDRKFMVRYMPKLESYFHYRNIDVSTVKTLCQYWHPEIAQEFTKKQQHTALLDILESIEELRYYYNKFFT